MKRCKDCKNKKYRYNRLMGVCPPWTAYHSEKYAVIAASCQNYARKWWKFWRPE